MGNSIKELVGKRLFALRGDSTLDEIAANLNKRLGYNSFTKQKLSKVENGGQEVNYEDLIALAKEYAVSTDYLLGLSETRLPESMGTVEYTGLTVEAANYLHTMHVADETRTKKSATPMCEMISEFLCHCSAAFQDMYFLYLTTKDMSAFNPRLGLLTDEQDAKMQYRAYMMANKYYGMCEIVSGKNYLRYKTEQIVNKMREAVARTIKFSDAVKACDKMTIENAEREYEIIKRKRPSEK